MIIKKIKDNKKRSLFFKLENLKKIYKIIFIAILNKKKYRAKQKFLYIKLLKLKQIIGRISKTQLKNRCLVSNRSKSIMRPFFLSRIKMREYINAGLLPGYKKAVW